MTDVRITTTGGIDKIFEGNARRVYGRLSAAIDKQSVR
jgi:hypothetical protein